MTKVRFGELFFGGDLGGVVLSRGTVAGRSEKRLDQNLFLHGFCTLAAIAIHRRFGHPVFRLADAGEVEEYGSPEPDSPGYPVVHDYLMTKAGEYVDIRGKIRDEGAFFSEFADLFDDPRTTPISEVQLENIERDCIRCMGKDTFSQYLEQVDAWVAEHPDLY